MKGICLCGNIRAAQPVAMMLSTCWAAVPSKHPSLRLLFVTAWSLMCICSTAQEHVGDSILHQDTGFRPSQLIVPTALIAVGAWGVNNGWLLSLNEDVRREVAHMRGDCYFRSDDYLQYLPVVANLGLGIAGTPARHPMRERIAITATSYAVMGLAINVTKPLVREKRPDSGAKTSFPSGHTATAFMGAELVRAEYGGWYGAGAYAFASCIAFLRIYNDRHWLNDVIAGAGIGMLSVRVAYWLLPWERKLLGWNKTQEQTLIPMYDPQRKSVEFSFTSTF